MSGSDIEKCELLQFLQTVVVIVVLVLGHVTEIKLLELIQTTWFLILTNYL